MDKPGSRQTGVIDEGSNACHLADGPRVWGGGVNMFETAKSLWWWPHGWEMGKGGGREVQWKKDPTG